MISVNVSSNIRQVTAQWSAFATAPESRVRKATERALNRALDQSQTEASRRIRDRYNVKAQVVSRALKKMRASARGDRLFAELRVQGARIPLVEFSATERRVRTKAGLRRGVSVRVLRGGQRKLVPGAFMQMVGGSLAGNRTIFKRAGVARYPIKFLRSVSIPQAFLNKAVIAAVKSVAAASFTRNFVQQVRFMGSAR
jgi:hypothetical protein